MAKKKKAEAKKDIEKSKEVEIEKNLKELKGAEAKKDIEKSKEGDSKNLRKKQNNQILWALVLMASIIIIIFLVPYIKQNVFNKFEYATLDFYKANINDIIFYYTEIPLINQQGFPIGDYSIYFRNDPRELENISVDIIERKIEFQKNNTVYISIQYDAPVCEDNIVSVVGLSNFLDKFGNLQIKGAMNDAMYASNNDLDYITCETNPDNTVILLKTGNETMISKTGRNCYELQYKECEINKATEKFILTIIENYMQKYNELDIKK
jgi:hypothetical protein